MAATAIRHRFVDDIVGRPWWVTAAGASSVVVYVVAAFLVHGLDGGARVVVCGGAVGGLVAGLALGTNVYDGMAAGVRAAATGAAVLTVLATAVFLALWYAGSGQVFLYWAPFYGLVGFVLFAPLTGFVGVAGGVVGVLVRRWALPDRLNPPAY